MKLKNNDILKFREDFYMCYISEEKDIKDTLLDFIETVTTCAPP